MGSFVMTRLKAIFDHSRVHLEAELAWAKDILAQVEMKDGKK
jgi:hypothetical protein